MAIREPLHARGYVPISSTVAKSATLDNHPLFLGNLALTLRRTIEQAEETLIEEDRFVTVVKNGEGVLPREVKDAEERFRQLKSLVEDVKLVAESAADGNLTLPEGAALACLQSRDLSSRCLVFALPGHLSPKLFNNESERAVEGARLLFFERNSDQVKPLLTAERGRYVTVSWDDKEYEVKEVIKEPL